MRLRQHDVAVCPSTARTSSSTSSRQVWSHRRPAHRGRQAAPQPTTRSRSRPSSAHSPHFASRCPSRRGTVQALVSAASLTAHSCRLRAMALSTERSFMARSAVRRGGLRRSSSCVRVAGRAVRPNGYVASSMHSKPQNPSDGFDSCPCLQGGVSIGLRVVNQARTFGRGYDTPCGPDLGARHEWFGISDIRSARSGGPRLWAHAHFLWRA